MTIPVLLRVNTVALARFGVFNALKRKKMEKKLGTPRAKPAIAFLVPNLNNLPGSCNPTKSKPVVAAAANTVEEKRENSAGSTKKF